MFKQLIRIFKTSWKRLLLTTASVAACFSIPFITGSFLFDQTAQFMTGIIAKADSEYVVHSLMPVSPDTNFTNKTRTTITDYQYQLSSLGSGVMYYYLDEESYEDKNDEFAGPIDIVLDNESELKINVNYVKDKSLPKYDSEENYVFDEDFESKTYHPFVVGSYSALLRNELDFELVEDELEEMDYVIDDSRHYYDVFISEGLAMRIEEQLGGEYYQTITDEDGTHDVYNHQKLIEDKIALPFKYYYGSKLAENAHAIIANVITDVNENKYGFSSKDEFVFTSYNALFLYRFTHAELRTSLKCSEKTTNNYVLTNLLRTEKSFKESINLTSKVYSIKNGKIVKGTVQQKYAIAHGYYNNLPSDFFGTILTIIIISACCIGLFFVEKQIQKKFIQLSSEDKKTIEFIETFITLIVFMIVFLFFKAISGFSIGTLAVNFVNPIVAVVSLIQVVIVLVEISYLVNLTPKSKAEKQNDDVYEYGFEQEPVQAPKKQKEKVKKPLFVKKQKVKKEDDDNNDSNYFDISI